MKKTIGIVAPAIGETHYHVDFTLRLARNRRELTLKTLYELAQNSYQTEKISRDFQYEEMGTAAGYYLSTILRQEGYQTVLTTTYDDEALQQLAQADPFAICLSTTMIIDMPSLNAIVRRIREYLPDTLLIAGGVYIWKSHYTDNGQRPLREQPAGQPLTLFRSNSAELGIDILIIAPHGREALLQVLREAEHGSRADFSQIPNLALPNSVGTFLFTPRQEEEVDYNSDYTRWDLLDELPKKIPFRTSIGCPFRCRFCDFCQLYPRIFLRSRESLQEELSLVASRSGNRPTLAYITDDNTFINAQRVHEVCDAIMNSGIVGWEGFVRASSVKPSNIALIRQSGMLQAMTGVESGDPGQLQRMNKTQNIEDVRQGIELLDQHNISTLMTFLVGFPGETAETIGNTIDFLNHLALNKASASYHLYPLSIVPLSEVTHPDFRKTWKIVGNGTTWSHATMNSDEAVEACDYIFKHVPYVPFFYLEKNSLFESQVFTREQRITLYALRQRLTVQILEQADWPPVAETLADISHTIGFPRHIVPESFRHEILVPTTEEMTV